MQVAVDSFRPRAVTAPVMTTKRRKDVNLEYKRKENERREQREIEYANARTGQDGKTHTLDFITIIILTPSNGTYEIR